MHGPSARVFIGEKEIGMIAFGEGHKSPLIMYQSMISGEAIISRKRRRTIKGTIIQFLYWLLEKMGEDLR